MRGGGGGGGGGVVFGGCGEGLDARQGGVVGGWVFGATLGEWRTSLKNDWPIHQRQADEGNHNRSAPPRPVANAATPASLAVMGC